MLLNTLEFENWSIRVIDFALSGEENETCSVRLALTEKGKEERVIPRSGPVHSDGYMVLQVFDRGLQMFLPSGNLRAIPMPPICTEEVEIENPLIDYNAFELSNRSVSFGTADISPFEIYADAENCCIKFDMLLTIRGRKSSKFFYRSGPHRDFKFSTMLAGEPVCINLKNAKIRKLRLPTEEDLLDPETKNTNPWEA